jgi:hypothetical protein
MEMRRRRHILDGAGGMLFALLLIVVGGYYLFRNTFGVSLPEIDGDAIWPIVVIAIGLGVLGRALAEHQAA